MSPVSRPKTGIRKIEDVDGGVIAWLYGATDLDDVLLDLVRVYEQDHDDAGVAISYHPSIGPRLPMPQGDPAVRFNDEDQAAWDAYWAHVPPYVGSIDEDIPTAMDGGAEITVDWFRRFPWCTCGEGHGWHYEQSNPGRGASLAVLVSWYS
jgi:hypothetical protein